MCNKTDLKHGLSLSGLYGRWETRSPWFLFREAPKAGYPIGRLLNPNMKPQLFAIDLILVCMSCGASALATSIPAGSTSLQSANFTSLGAAQRYGTDTAAVSRRSRRKRYISQNDMLAILDYHNKVRGKVFPPASNMEYMVGGLSVCQCACVAFSNCTECVCCV